MLESLFTPQSVAVIGASTQPGKVGHSIFRNMLQYGFSGPVYPINPKTTELLGVRCYPSILQVPGEVELALVVVPARIVPQVLAECGEKKVQAAVIISAGFKEVGAKGAQLEREVVDIARKYNLRVLGPNCLGVIVTSSGLNASFAAGMPLPGPIAFMSQSGALCTAILDWALAEGVGFSKFVSLGNKADLCETDFLRAWEEDAETKVILAYLEGIANGPEFMQVAQEVSRRKPVIIVKSGGTAAGARAASSHTGTLAGSERAYEAAFQQTGVIRARSVEELFDYALAFAYQPRPRGSRLAIVTNAGGPGIMATDACERAGLTLASLRGETVEHLRQHLPPAGNFYNPVDVLGDADAARYRLATEAVLQDANVDAVMAILTPQEMTQIEETAEVLGQLAVQADKPLVACFMGEQKVHPGREILERHQVPNYEYPERAVAALAAMARYVEWQHHPQERPRRYEVDREKAAAILARARDEQRVNLSEFEAQEVIAAYGFALPASKLATTPEEAVTYAEEIGYPVVLKISSPDILHKSDIGGVRVGLSNPEQVTDAFELMLFRAARYMPEAEIRGVLVQEMIGWGKEVILGMSRDPQFGPLVMFGLGGIYVEVLKDVAFRVAPFGELEARQMVQEIHSYPLLTGVRGEKPADLEAIVSGLLRLSQLVTDLPEIVEMDINPLKVREAGRGAVALDVRVTIGS
ncbi:MAG TPA: CoA-binding protein [Armatimonadetes bacterium]|nr:CoA-binding protein [Armatimonadota bacterium]